MAEFEGLVAVTGGTGETGSLVVKKLKERGVKVRAVVRNEQKAREMLGEGVELAVADTLDKAALEKAFHGASALVILTSAKPMMTGMGPDNRPQFAFPEGGTPEIVDFHGQVAQVDAAVAAGVEHVVLVGSIGMADPDKNFLNQLGGGKILTWKKKGEEHLIASGLPYTCIHPGGLVNDPGGKEILVSHNDEGSGRISREDVAEVCVQALTAPEARYKVFDINGGEGPQQTDWKAVFAQA